MELATAFLKKHTGAAFKAGGAWIYDNEVDRVEGDPADGDIVALRDFDGYPLGRGFYNSRSRLRLRMLTRRLDQEIDTAFLRGRVQAAWDYRKRVIDTASCRLIFGEADFLPGLVVDKFGEVLVLQSTSVGMERLKGTVIDLLLEVLAADGIAIRGVYERSDSRERAREGLPPADGFFRGEFSTQVEIVENGVRYLVDVAEGQKTGFFLDQKLNRLAIQPLCRGAKVLDCFTHTGSFALNAGIAGAASVLGVDSSRAALDQAERNAALNGLSDRVTFRCADVLDLLPELERQGERYDVIVLDPPAFAKTRTSVKNAMKGYRDINIRGMRLLRDGGYLATCSCSRFLTEDLFKKVLAQAAQSAHVRLRQVEARTQAPDHPILWAADESYYLKFSIFQVVRDR